MQALNFCRQITRQFSGMLAERGDRMAPHLREALEYGIESARNAVKFQLPDGGRMLDDIEYRALDPDEPLRLPFPWIALEFLQANAGVAPGEVASSKRVAFCRQMQGGIGLFPVCYLDRTANWIPLPEIGIPETGYLNRSIRNAEGRPAIRASLGDTFAPASDYADELDVVLSFLNALACSNVRPVRVDQKQPKRPALGALPFDSFHVLTIAAPGGGGTGETRPGGTHRSPREHLRRGHIRRYENGRKVWINSMVVNAGKGATVGKAYRMDGTP